MIVYIFLGVWGAAIVSAYFGCATHKHAHPEWSLREAKKWERRHESLCATALLLPMVPIIATILLFGVVIVGVPELVGRFFGKRIAARRNFIEGERKDQDLE